MLPFEEALGKVLALAKPLGSERVEIEHAVGRALSVAITASRTLPPWNNSAMDGYAVRSIDCPGQLQIIEKIFAGQQPKESLGAGQCSRIMTGAPMPQGADAVVMQENTRVLEGDRVEILPLPVRPGGNVRLRGEDVKEGQTLFDAGRALGVPDAAVLWAQGLTHVEVFRRPRVAIASSGDELFAVGETGPGLIDTNTPMLALAVTRAGGLPTQLALSPDRLEVITQSFSKGLDFDVLLTVSGASVGERDFTQDALRLLGVEVEFWRVAMKPGKPLLVGRKGSTLVFGLPGNPVSALVSFELFVRPALRQLQGLNAASHAEGKARLEGQLSKATGVRLFARANIERRGEEWWAVPLGSQSSGALASASGATHLISVAPEVAIVGHGEKVDLISVAWGA